MEDIAAAWHRSPATIRGYIEQWSRPPAKDVLDLAADYFRVDRSELWGPELLVVTTFIGGTISLGLYGVIDRLDRLITRP